MGGIWSGSHMVAFQNCWVCVETIVKVGTVGFDSGIVGGKTVIVWKCCSFGSVWSWLDVPVNIFFSHVVIEATFSNDNMRSLVSCLRTLH